MNSVDPVAELIQEHDREVIDIVTSHTFVAQRSAKKSPIAAITSASTDKRSSEVIVKR